MKQRLTHESKQREQEQELQGEATHQQNQGPLEFASAEELLRFDATRTTVPPALGDRVLQDVAAEQKQKPWWKRWL